MTTGAAAAVVTPVITAAAPSGAPKRAAHSSSSHSVLGALNAYHASPKAFENASPNSRLGKLATYVEQRAAAHDTLTDRRKTVETRRTELAILQQNAAATAEQIARAQQALAAAELALAEIEAPLLATLELAANKMVTAAVWAEIDAELTQRGMLPAE